MKVCIKNVIGGLFFAILLSSISYAAKDAIICDDLIIFPKDKTATAKLRIMNMINSAHQSIDLAAYQIKDPQIVDVLATRASRGIRVRLIIETNPLIHAFNKAEQGPHLEKLREAGVEIHTFPPTRQGKKTNGHLHAKYMIVDGVKFVLCTGNFDETTFDHCRDFGVVISNNKENKEQFKFLQDLFEGDWENNPRATASGHPSIYLGPENQREQIITFIKSAQKTLWLYQQYCNDPEIANVLVDLKKKGVQIKLLMMPYPTSYDMDPNQKNQDSLAKAGVNVKLLSVKDKTYVHARSIIVDGAVALVGSANLSALSLDKNRDLSVLIKGKALETLKKQFSNDWSKAITLEKGRQEALEQKVDWNNRFFDEL